MQLDKLYSLRKSFTIIGLTGRLGSGCSKVARILSTADFSSLKIRTPNQLHEYNDFSRKYKICYNYTRENWRPYIVINYKDVLLLYLLREPNDTVLAVIKKIYKKDVDGIHQLLIDYRGIIHKLKTLKSIGYGIERADLGDFGNFFFNSDYLKLAKEFFDLLNLESIPRRIDLCHHIANNIRATGSPILSGPADPENIYKVAETINRLIKAWKKINQNKVQIIIDSLRNSLEIMFFKERYSAFYMIATNANQLRDKISESIKAAGYQVTKDVLNEIEEIDETEYRCNDFKKGKFYVPDVQNCIQKADIHLNTDIVSIPTFNDSLDDNQKAKVIEKEGQFQNVDEQLVKFIALINQPGLVTPTAYERCMQVAYNAKYNSGCISRQVGAVVTDSGFSIKSVGWNDVPAGSVPCLQRDVRDLIQYGGPSDNNAYSTFEKEAQINIGKDTKFNRRNFLTELRSEFEDKLKSSNLQGRNCPFCFKSAYNAFEGNENQVHTRSLHAEENAMLQISKHGGVALKGGNLFTTASPCELCSKKAYQLGIINVYYIDPYPGISQQHILATGKVENQPQVHLFSGAVGRAYHKLYEPFMAYKDELAMLTNVRPSISITKKVTDITKEKGFDKSVAEKLENLLMEGKLSAEDLSKIIDKGLNENSLNKN